MEDVQKTLFRQSASSLKEDKHVFIQRNSRLTIYDPIFFACRSNLFRVILKSVKQYMTIGKRLKLEYTEIRVLRITLLSISLVKENHS